jgi:hypothetical protein
LAVVSEFFLHAERLDASLKYQRETFSCFVATAAYGSPYAVEVVFLRRYRDEVMARTVVGRCVVAIYHRVSPPIASFIRRREPARRISRQLLGRLVIPWVRSRLGRSEPKTPELPWFVQTSKSVLHVCYAVHCVLPVTEFVDQSLVDEGGLPRTIVSTEKRVAEEFFERQPYQVTGWRRFSLDEAAFGT